MVFNWLECLIISIVCTDKIFIGVSLSIASEDIKNFFEM